MAQNQEQLPHLPAILRHHHQEPLALQNRQNKCAQDPLPSQAQDWVSPKPNLDSSVGGRVGQNVVVDLQHAVVQDHKKCRQQQTTGLPGSNDGSAIGVTLRMIDRSSIFISLTSYLIMEHGISS